MRFELPGISKTADYVATGLLLVLAIGLLVSRNQGGINGLRKASIVLFSYVEEPLANIRVYRQALRTNTELRKQNIQLLNELNQLRSARQRNDELRALLQFSRSSDLNYFPVQVIGKELTGINNVITVNAGTADGIQQGMPMVAANGLVGKVVLTSAHYAQIMPFYNRLFRLSAKLQHSNTYGIISWNGERNDELNLNYVPQTAQVDTGEFVVTSGLSNEYPADITIGTVRRSVPVEGQNTQDVFVEPSVDLFSIAEGFIITTRPSQTVDSLNSEYETLFE